MNTRWFAALSFVAAALWLAGCAASRTAVRPETDFIAFDEALAAHGEWLRVPGHGKVWRPSAAEVGADFRPYVSHGHWVLTDVGWSYFSDFEWGWAPFHYGRWTHEPAHGWLWSPARQWAPAWVEWRVGGGFIGWAPTPPRGISPRESHWFFVEARRFTESDVAAHGLAPERAAEAMLVTREMPAPDTSGVAFCGPSRRHVERALGHPVSMVRHPAAVPAGVLLEQPIPPLLKHPSQTAPKAAPPAEKAPPPTVPQTSEWPPPNLGDSVAVPGITDALSAATAPPGPE
jgi:hypothetical protein